MTDTNPTYDYENEEDDTVSNGNASTAAPVAPTSTNYTHHHSSLENKPRILLMGLRRSGKSSITKVVFHKMSPNETLFLESTTKVVKNEIFSNSFVQFQVWDFPGQMNFFDSTFDAEAIFGNCGALVYVIDSQDDEKEPALLRFQQTVLEAVKVNPKITFEVFIHKVDGLTDDQKIEVQRSIQKLADEILEDGHVPETVRPSYYLTSIYDHSIFEAFSKVVQKLIPQVRFLGNLLDMLLASCRLEKAFLFDVVSKIYIASDSSPTDAQSYELCSDMIDVVIDVSCIYGLKENSNPLAYDDQSRSIIKLGNGTVLYLREMNKYLALVCLMRKENFDKHGVLEYNFSMLKEGIVRVFQKPPKKSPAALKKEAAKQ